MQQLANPPLPSSPCLMQTFSVSLPERLTMCSTMEFLGLWVQAFLMSSLVSWALPLSREQRDMLYRIPDCRKQNILKTHSTHTHPIFISPKYSQMRPTWPLALLLLALPHLVSSLYCEPSNCYDLLELSPSATQEEIKKAFRVMAKRLHPDRNQREDTTQIFQKINIAYEILDNENTRKAYDLFLNDPSGYRAYHTYQYYKASYSPQTNPFLVIFIFVLLVSWLQWVMRKQMYQSAFDRIIESEDFRKRVNEECVNQGKKGDKRLKQEVAEKLQKDICIQGGYSEPNLLDLLVFKILFFPYSFLLFVWGWLRWIAKYYIKRQDYELKDQQYLTKKVLKVPKAKWEHLPEDQKKELLGRRLWEKRRMAEYMEEMKMKQLEEIKATNPAKYRKIMAYLKKNQ